MEEGIRVQKQGDGSVRGFGRTLLTEIKARGHKPRKKDDFSGTGKARKQFHPKRSQKEMWHSDTLIFFFFFFFLNPQHMEVPRLGVELEIQLPAYITATTMGNPSHFW